MNTKKAIEKNKKNNKRKTNTTLTIPLPIVIIIIILFFILFNYKIINKKGISKANLTDLKNPTYNEDYKKTSELTADDEKDTYQKNYQETLLDDGGYLIKSAEWTNKDNGEALITLEGTQFFDQEQEYTVALYVATMCYSHGLTEDILLKNIKSLIKNYDYVDFVAINNGGESGILNPKRFSSTSSDSEIRNYLRSAKNSSGNQYPHYTCSIPVAIQKYLFGNKGDDYISEDNLINDPMAIYVSCDTLYSRNSENWGVEYATEKYFNFIQDAYANRYFSMSQTSQTDSNPTILIRYSSTTDYSVDVMNTIIGVLNPENYGQADLVLSEENLKKWENSNTEQLTLSFQSKEFAADYNYSKTFEEAGVIMVAPISLKDIVQDDFEIVNVETYNDTDILESTVNGQEISVENDKYVSGEVITVKITVKIKKNEYKYYEGFKDTNAENAIFRCNTKEISVGSPKLAPSYNNYTINYLEKETNEPIKQAKIVNNIIFNTEIKTTDEVINIDGYNYDSADKEILVIGAGENVINLYYTKRTDLSYTVNYLEKDTNKVLSNQKIENGQTYQNVITSADEAIQIYGYQYDSADKETLTIGIEENVINLYYVRKETSVIVHHYIENTTDKVPSKTKGEVVEDEIKTGYVGDKYESEISNNVALNYEYVSHTTNTSGEMTEETIEVIYYYKIKQANIEKNTIIKTGTDEITENTQEVNYTITYNASVDEYIGNVEITIVDKLPYEINELKSNISEGIYDPTEKTITWTETIEDIDTYEYDIKEINITKEISLVYVNMDYEKTSFTNKAEGEIKLEATKQTSKTEEVSLVTQTEFTKDVQITKIWDHTNNIYKKPTGIEIQVKNENLIVEKATLTNTNATEENENIWQYEFTDLPKYNSQGEEITYNVEEVEINKGELDYYNIQIENITEGDLQKVTIKNTYKGPVINSNKEMTTENGHEYVIEGEKITYTIKAENIGQVGKNILIKDNIPEGTTFVNESIKVNGESKYSINTEEVDLSIKTEEDLSKGILVNVPARESENKSGEVTVSFEVIVDKLEEDVLARTISNIASINKEPENPERQDESTNTVSVPILTYKKIAEIIKNEEIDLAGNNNITEGAVTAGDRIKYTIIINNVGKEAIKNIEIKDTVPNGTTIYSINNDGEISLNDTNIITWNIEEILIGEEIQVSFEVTVNYDKQDKLITNIGTVDGKETNKIEIQYEVPEVDLQSNIVKDGIERITTTEDKINYTIDYSAEIREFVGNATLKIVDYLPYEIDEKNSEISGGIYNAKDRTITWEENIENINTYKTQNGAVIIEREKAITLKYIYTDEENLSGKIENNAKGTITLIQQNETEDIESSIKEETKEDNHNVKVEIPERVIVHHYIYDEEKGGETDEKVPSKDGEIIEDEIINGIAGDRYSTKPSDNINENYECINVTPDRYEGTMTKTDIQVIYYYKLKATKLGGIIVKTAEASKKEEVEYQTGEVDEQGKTITETKTIEVLTKEDDVVKYEITYRSVIKDYKGKAKITIIDKLPADLNIDDSRISLDDGTYDALNKTITWEEIVDVDTFITGAMYDKIFKKEINVVYKNQNVLDSLENTAEGITMIYYPENHSTKPGGERGFNIKTDTAEVKQEYLIDKEVEKVWDDKENTKKRRPNSVTIQLTANGNTAYNGKELEKVVLNEANHWKYTFTNLPKYNELGQVINYSVIETETNEGDLEYYDTPVITPANDRIIVTNKYKLMETKLDSKIEKYGTDKITASKQEVIYNINYQAAITDYIGEASVKIVDQLPYEIDENELELSGGIYDKDTKTITWEENIDHINTYLNGKYDVEINKTIKVVYNNLDINQRKITNNVEGTLNLYETEQTNTTSSNFDTKIEIPGKVVVKYVDKDNGKEITYKDKQEESEEIEKTYGYEISGIAGDSYITELKEIPAYTYVGNNGLIEGNYIEGTIEAIYYYERTIAGGVSVSYKDEEGNEILETDIYEGLVGDKYEVNAKDIYGYKYVRAEGITAGEMTEGVIEVTYIYKKIPAKVIIKYLEKDETNDDSDNQVLYTEEIVEGYVGDNYKTNPKELENYQLVDPKPTNQEGKMTLEDIYVTYYYEKIPSGRVIIQYMDIDTNEEILYQDEETGEYKTYREEKEGYVGDKYETEQIIIPYYKIVKAQIPINKNGEFKKEDIYVTYYYKKLEFNIDIDKNIEKILINSIEQKVENKKMSKVEVDRKKINDTNITIIYNIKVTNTGEIDGIATILEILPQNFKIGEETTDSWIKAEDGTIETDVELKAGETKELKVELNWINGENNFGTFKNTVTILKTTNQANYEDGILENNESSAEIIIGIKTGATMILTILSIGILILLLIILIYILKIKLRKKNI